MILSAMFNTPKRRYWCAATQQHITTMFARQLLSWSNSLSIKEPLEHSLAKYTECTWRCVRAAVCRLQNSKFPSRTRGAVSGGQSFSFVCGYGVNTQSSREGHCIVAQKWCWKNQPGNKFRYFDCFFYFSKQNVNTNAQNRPWQKILRGTQVRWFFLLLRLSAVSQGNVTSFMIDAVSQMWAAPGYVFFEENIQHVRWICTPRTLYGFVWVVFKTIHQNV